MSNATNRDQLNREVRNLLGALLQQADFPGSEQLLAHAPSVSVRGDRITMLELRPSHDTPPSACTEGPIPLSMVVSNPAGDLIGELLVWVEAGYLTSLEYAWWSDDPPSELPDADRVAVTRR